MSTQPDPDIDISFTNSHLDNSPVLPNDVCELRSRGQKNDIEPILEPEYSRDRETMDAVKRLSLLSRRSELSTKSPSVKSESRTTNSQTSIWRSVGRLWKKSWVPEFLCCGLSIISLIGILIMLKLHDGKPLPQWPLDLTINASLAMLLVLFKIGLALPLSQGKYQYKNSPFYSFQLIYNCEWISQLKWQTFRKGPQRLIDMEDYDSASRSAWGLFCSY